MDECQYSAPASHQPIAADCGVIRKGGKIWARAQHSFLNTCYFYMQGRQPAPLPNSGVCYSSSLERWLMEVKGARDEGGQWRWGGQRGWGAPREETGYRKEVEPPAAPPLLTRPIAISCMLQAISDRRTDGPTDQWTNWPTDQWTNGPTDQWTDKAAYRVACTQLKMCFLNLLQCHREN